jgi:hypothetical protein
MSVHTSTFPWLKARHVASLQFQFQHPPTPPCLSSIFFPRLFFASPTSRMFLGQAGDSFLDLLLHRQFPIAADTSDKSMLSATLFVRVPGHRDEPVGVTLIPLSKVKTSDHRVMHDWFSLAPPARGNANNRPPPIMPVRGTTQVRLLLKLED